MHVTINELITAIYKTPSLSVDLKRWKRIISLRWLTQKKIRIR